MNPLSERKATAVALFKRLRSEGMKPNRARDEVNQQLGLTNDPYRTATLSRYLREEKADSKKRIQ